MHMPQTTEYLNKALEQISNILIYDFPSKKEKRDLDEAYNLIVSAKEKLSA